MADRAEHHPEHATNEGGQSAFWDEKFRGREELLFGAAPNAFVREEMGRIPQPADVIELGAGEGRNAVELARRGHRVTALDFSSVALAKAKALAEREGVHIETVEADVLEWEPRRMWDAVVITFLQLLPKQRPQLYERAQDILKEGGWLLAQWFRPDQVKDNYDSGGPPTVDRMPTAEELRLHFPKAGILRCEEVVTTLDEGSILHGAAAVVQLLYRKPIEAASK